jgi:hypothetical protein
MAIISKDGYAGKREWAANRIAENKKIETLTKEQHEALAKLCRIRHELHTNQKTLFFAESGDHQRLWKYIDLDWESEYHIDNILHEANLPKIGINTSGADYPTDHDYEDMGYDYEEALSCVLNMAEAVNTKIEIYLREIDEQYGTNYCPSGITRLL